MIKEALTINIGIIQVVSYRYSTESQGRLTAQTQTVTLWSFLVSGGNQTEHPEMKEA